MQHTLKSWFRGLGDLGTWFLYRSLEVSADVSISANSQPTRAVESDHLVASCTRRRDECLLDATNFLADNFSGINPQSNASVYLCQLFYWSR